MEIVESIGSPVLWPERDLLVPWLDFLASAIGSLAWPVLIISVVLLFRKPIARLIGRIKKGEVGGVKFDFGDEVTEVFSQSQGIDLPDPAHAEQNEARRQELLHMAEVSPTGAIIEAWKDVEAAAQELVERCSFLMTAKDLSHWTQDVRRRNFVSTFRFLANFKMLPTVELNTLEELRQLRNRAAHDQDIADEVNTEAARKYIVVADKLVDLFKQQIDEVANGTVFD